MDLTPQVLVAARTGFKTIFQRAFDGAPSDYDKVAMVVPSTNRQETYGWLGQATGFRKWLSDRIIQNLKAHGYTIVNEAFENTVGVDRDDIEDDALGVYAPMFEQLGMDAKAHPNELVFGLLASGFTGVCYDGQYFFDTDHPVMLSGAETSVSNFSGGAGTPWYLIDATKAIKPIIFQKRRDYQFVAMDRPDDEEVFNKKQFRYGVDCRVNAGYGLWQLAHASKQDLDATNFNAAFASMQSIKGDNGKPLGVNPSLLVVPPTLREAAMEIAKAERDANGATNVNRGVVEVLVTPWLA